jgi:hypothetical protein
MVVLASRIPADIKENASVKINNIIKKLRAFTNRLLIKPARYAK